MKTGILFRSDGLARLTDSDLEILKKLNLRTICDLRAPKERKSKPDRFPLNSGIRNMNLPIFSNNMDSNRLQRFLWVVKGKFKDLDSQKFMNDFYHVIAFDHTAQIADVLTMISDEKNLPLLVHCTGGKDRTGFVSAILQILAGVSKEIVFEDYLLTNQLIEPQIIKFIRRFRILSFSKITPEKIRTILEARREYLETVLDEVIKRFGSIENYLEEGCSIDKSTIIKLKELLINH
jgi:protein-tyrosine phosphatase